MKGVVLYLIAMLTLAWMWGQLLEYLDWKIRQRRIFRNVMRRIEAEERQMRRGW